MVQKIIRGIIRHVFKHNLKESNRIESLVTDLLDLSHIEQRTRVDTDYINYQI